MKEHSDTGDRATFATPMVVLVDADRGALAALELTLCRRFSPDYRIVTADSAHGGLELLGLLAQRGEDVALVAVDLRLPEMDGIAFLEQACLLHRCAIRALLVALGNRGARIPFGVLEPLQRATALGRIDFWVLKGWNAPEELLYPHIQEALTTWTRANRPQYEVLRIVGERWSPHSHDLRDTIARNTIPFGFYPADTRQGQRLLDEYNVDVKRLPAVILHNGLVLHQPSHIDIANALGVDVHPSTELYDLAILGAGPAGLAAAVYGASEGLRTVVIEPQAIGGQAGTSSMIRNYLGFPWGINGGELAFRALEQALMFGAQLILMQHATKLEMRENERVVTLTDGCQVRAKAVIVAAGIDYRRLAIPALERLIGMGVFYGATGVEAPAMAGENVYVVGGANSAGQAAQHLARFANHVTLVVRGASLEAGMSEYLISQIHATPNIHVRLQTRVIGGSGNKRLETLTLEDIATGQQETIPAAALFVMIGAEPRTNWLRDVIACDENGFVLTSHNVPDSAWPLARSPLSFETSVPGVFTVGDARHGSVKRVAGAVGEGSVAVGSVHRYLAELSEGGI